MNTEEKEIVYWCCEKCNKDINKEEDEGQNVRYRDGQSDYTRIMVCQDCYDNLRYCDCCDCHIDEDDATWCENDTVCERCREYEACSCDGCGEVFYQSNMRGDRCESCADDMEVPERDYSTKLISNGHKGNIINSERSFGVELEFDAGSSGAEMAEKLPDTLGISGDGSVSGDNPIEMQTPPLMGDAGEDYIHNICAIMAKYDAKVNISCGMHVHISAKDYKRSYSKLRDLIMFYCATEDVITSFLPSSRRSNHYCKTFKQCLGEERIEKIKRCKTMAELERIYYGFHGHDARTAKQYVEREKNGKYSGARYAAVNMHSLLCDRGGTIEIRSHSGTTSAIKILYWVELHTRILDKMSNRSGKVRKEAIDTFASKMSLEEKTYKLFEFLGLKKDARAYLAARQGKFNYDRNVQSDQTTANGFTEEDTEGSEVAQLQREAYTVAIDASASPWFIAGGSV